jgi:DNA mismatch endonuclease, patch repair protein
MDIIGNERCGWKMSRIGPKDTSPEVSAGSILHRIGYRSRLHVPRLPARLAILLPKWKAVIFVNGCFWHRHVGCGQAYTPKTQKQFWLKQFKDNIERHKRNEASLVAAGWKLEFIRECEVGDRATHSPAEGRNPPMDPVHPTMLRYASII